YWRGFGRAVAFTSKKKGSSKMLLVAPERRLLPLVGTSLPALSRLTWDLTLAGLPACFFPLACARSAPTSRDRSALSPNRLLRSAGPGSGQIRNASPGACRGTIGAAGLSRLRFLPHLVLPSQIGFYAGRNPGARTVPGQTLEREGAPENKSRVNQRTKLPMANQQNRRR